jgi:hypothetical protein
MRVLKPDLEHVSGGNSIPVPMLDATKRVGTRPHPVIGTPLPVSATHIVFRTPEVGGIACRANLSKTTKWGQ